MFTMSTAQRRKNLEDIVEQKILEFFGDPDAGLELRKSFSAEMRKRLKKKQRLFGLSEVVKKYGFR